MKSSIRCDECGKMMARVDEMWNCANCGVEVPVETAVRPAATKPSAAPKARPRQDPRDMRPEFNIQDTGAPLIQGSLDPDDDKPYTVPGTGLKPCIHCRQKLPLDAVFCVHCGKSLKNDAQVELTYDTMEEEFGEGWTLTTRVQIFSAFQVVNALILGLTLALEGPFAVFIALSVMFFFVIMPSAFILGTYRTLILKRSSKGKCTMLHRWRAAFVPFPPKKIPWQSSVRVGIISESQSSGLDWALFIYLLTCGLLPGILFYNMVIAKPWFDVALCDTYGSKNLAIFRTTDEVLARQVADLTAKAARFIFRN